MQPISILDHGSKYECFFTFWFSYFELYCLFGFMLFVVVVHPAPSGDFGWEVDVFILITLWETGVEL